MDPVLTASRDGSTRCSVIFVREAEVQLTGSGCCGRLEGDVLGCAPERVFPERRAAMEAMGPLYRALRGRYGDAVDIEVVDPRNTVGLSLVLVRDFRRFEVSAWDALVTLARLTVQALVVNGRLVARGAWPEPQELLDLIESTLSTPPAASRLTPIIPTAA